MTTIASTSKDSGTLRHPVVFNIHHRIDDSLLYPAFLVPYLWQ